MNRLLNLIIFISVGSLALIGFEIIGTIINHYSLSVRLGFLTSKGRIILYIFTAIMQVIGIIASIIKINRGVNWKAKIFFRIYLLTAVLYSFFFAIGLMFGASMMFPQL